MRMTIAGLVVAAIALTVGSDPGVSKTQKRTIDCGLSPRLCQCKSQKSSGSKVNVEIIKIFKKRGKPVARAKSCGVVVDLDGINCCDDLHINECC